MSSSTAFYLPMTPIPLSACFKNARRNGRIKTERYTEWIVENAMYVKKHSPDALGRKGYPRHIGSVCVHYVIQRPDNRKRDLDNMLKALNDLLVHLQIIKDDSAIVDLRIRYGNPDAPVLVMIHEALAPV